MNDCHGTVESRATPRRPCIPLTTLRRRRLLRLRSRATSRRPTTDNNIITRLKCVNRQIFLDQIELSCAWAAEKRSARHKTTGTRRRRFSGPSRCSQPGAESRRNVRTDATAGFGIVGTMRPRFVPTHSKTRALSVKVNGDPPALARGRKWWLFARSIARGAASYRRKKFGRTATRS